MKAVFKSGKETGGKNPFERYIVTHPMGDIIFSEGDIGTEMFILQSGAVELFKQIAGETRVLATLEKGDFFGEMSVLEDLPRTADIVIGIVAAYLLITGLLVRCVVYKAAGIDTSIQEQPYSTTDDRSGL